MLKSTMWCIQTCQVIRYPKMLLIPRLARPTPGKYLVWIVNGDVKVQLSRVQVQAQRLSSRTEKMWREVRASKRHGG